MDINETFSDKLTWEWEEFSSNVTGLSRETIFSLAKQIADKKQIYDALKASRFSEEELCQMCQMEHVIDTLYLRMTSVSQSPELTEQIKKTLEGM